jgi:DHA1 family tetracycline resistance protein-like MFS transporter
MSDAFPPSPSPAQPAARKRATIFILITILLDTIGFGIIAPVMPELIMELTGEGIGQAARYGGWLLFIYAVMQLFFAPVLGNLSDRFGRRPVLLCSLTAFGLDYILMGMAPTLTWLFVGRALAGVFGATHATANAYVADITVPAQRAKSFGLIGATWGIGFMIGPVVGGLLGEYGPRVPFFAAAGLALLNVVYGSIVLTESLSEENRRPFAWKRANPIGAIHQMRRYPVVIGLFFAVVFYQIAHDANPSTWSFYTMLKFGWSERDIGLSMGAVGLMMAIVQGGLIGFALKRFGEQKAVIGGYALMAMAYFGFAYASKGWMMYAFMIPFALGSIVTPAIRAILANLVPDNAQGELQGAISSLQSLTAIFAPLFMTQLFGFFSSDAAPIYFPGAPFFAAGALVLISIVVFQRVMARASTDGQRPETVQG